jgi:NAD(P)H-quinone oxidoreductase subunit 2
MNFLLDIKQSMLPEAILSILILIITMLTFLLPKERQNFIFYASAIGLLLATVSVGLLNASTYSAFYNSFVSSNLTILFRMLILIGASLTLLLSKKYVSRFGNSTGEYYVLLLTATLGAMLLSGANDLIMIFIGLETLSISSYVLAGYTKCDRLSNEAALKYLVIGGASTGVLLYGFSYLYGITGSTNLIDMAYFLHNPVLNPVLILALILVFAGFGFKLAAVPFHAWAPDVYQGAPIPVAAFLSVVSKTAGFAVIIRVFNELFGNVEYVSFIIALFAVLTMSVGNLMAIGQENIKRMMAYSSIAQAGYLLAGLAVMTDLGISSVVFYLITYLFMNFGAWAAIEIFVNKTGKDKIDDFGGLAFKNPLFATGLTLCLLSLAGIPITAGFFSKFYLFQAIVFAGNKYLPLLAIVLINTLIAVYYYLKAARVMFLKPAVEPDTSKPLIEKSVSLNTVLLFSTIGVLLIGLLSYPFINLSQNAVITGKNHILQLMLNK